MLDLGEVDRLVTQAVKASLMGNELSRVYSEPTIDSSGKDALVVTLVIRPTKGQKASGDSTLDAIVRIQRALYDSGDERFPIVEFATEDELAWDGDP